MHKRKKITFLPLTPAEIVKCEQEIAENKRKEFENESENQQVAKKVFSSKKEKATTTSKSDGIKLKGYVMLATKSDLAEICDNELLCYTLICKDALVSLENISSSLPSIVANLLQEFMDVFLAEVPLGLPPIQGIEHQIDLIPGATLPNYASYRTNPEETKEIQ